MLECLRESDVSRRLGIIKPVLLVDSAEIDVEGENEAFLSTKCFVDENYPFWECHFTNNPVMPGTYMLEMMAQSAALLTMIIAGCDSVPIIIGITNVRFLREIKPNQHIKAEIRLKKITNQYYTTVGRIICENKKVCTAEMMHYVKIK